VLQRLGAAVGLGRQWAGRMAGRRVGPSHRVEPLAFGDLSILLQQVERTWEGERWPRHKHLIVDNAVHERAKLRLDRRQEEPNEGTAEHFGRKPNLISGTHDANGVWRIGGKVTVVRIRRLYCLHYRRVVGRRGGVLLVRYDFETADLLDALARAVSGILGKFGIRGDNGDCLRARPGSGRELK